MKFRLIFNAHANKILCLLKSLPTHLQPEHEQNNCAKQIIMRWLTIKTSLTDIFSQIAFLLILNKNHHYRKLKKYAQYFVFITSALKQNI